MHRGRPHPPTTTPVLSGGRGGAMPGAMPGTSSRSAVSRRLIRLRGYTPRSRARVSYSRVSQPWSVSWSTTSISEAPAGDGRILVERPQQLRLRSRRFDRDGARTAVDADQVRAVGDPRSCCCVRAGCTPSQPSAATYRCTVPLLHPNYLAIRFNSQPSPCRCSTASTSSDFIIVCVHSLPAHAPTSSPHVARGQFRMSPDTRVCRLVLRARQRTLAGREKVRRVSLTCPGRLRTCYGRAASRVFSPFGDPRWRTVHASNLFLTSLRYTPLGE